MKILQQIVLATLFAPLLSFCVLAQTTAEWTRIESPKKDWSLSIPNSFLVENNKKRFKIYMRSKQLSGYIAMDTLKRAKNRFEIRFSLVTKAELRKLNLFELGDFIGSVRTYNREKPFRKNYTIDFASSRGLNSISVSTATLEETSLQNLLKSIRLENESLFKKQPVGLKTTASVNISSLQTSPSILEALKKKDSKQKNLPKLDRANSGDVDDTSKYDGAFVVVRKPIPSFASGARNRRVSGKVKLKVKFLRTGEIGEISLATSLDPDLDYQAFQAAKKIKFLPETINGKPVDIEKLLQYSFTVY